MWCNHILLSIIPVLLEAISSFPVELISCWNSSKGFAAWIYLGAFCEWVDWSWHHCYPPLVPWGNKSGSLSRKWNGVVIYLVLIVVGNLSQQQTSKGDAVMPQDWPQGFFYPFFIPRQDSSAKPTPVMSLVRGLINIWEPKIHHLWVHQYIPDWFIAISVTALVKLSKSTSAQVSES